MSSCVCQHTLTCIYNYVCVDIFRKIFAGAVSSGGVKILYPDKSIYQSYLYSYLSF